jgi:hypothetical protein
MVFTSESIFLMESLREFSLEGSIGTGLEKEPNGDNSIRNPRDNPRIIEFKHFI